jgi:tetratricopeptide (TPR) repeat protein
LTASILNSRLNLRLCITHLRLHETPNLGVHQTGSSSFLGADAEAAAWLRRSIDAQPNLPWTHFNLAAALAQLGRLDEAQAAARAGLALDPNFTLRRFRLNPPSDNPSFLSGRERIYEGLRLAGVPEG